MSGHIDHPLPLTAGDNPRAPWRAEHIGQGFAIALLLSVPLWGLIAGVVWAIL
jgi:hypothetical protein